VKEEFNQRQSWLSLAKGGKFQTAVMHQKQVMRLHRI